MANEVTKALEAPNAAMAKIAAMGDNQLDSLIASLCKRSKTLQMDIHNAIAGIAIQWAKTGDVRPAVRRINTLIDNLGEGVRRNAIREYVEMFFQLQYAEDGDMKGKFVAHPAKTDGKHLVIKDIINARWFDFKPEAKYVPIDFAAQLDKLLKRAMKADESKGDNVDKGLVQALAKARIEYLAEQATNA